VPYPYAAQDHQTHNARYIESQKAAVVLMQENLSAETLYEQIVALLCDDARLADMRKRMRDLAKPDAARVLAMQLKEISALYGGAKSLHAAGIG
jgi:UDP-N-acetylglucosamine--N-acetylmuramyl-(pentapeptide) pyrophosphoryl-undecaprenol N-acetylglucosamine transferase